MKNGLRNTILKTAALAALIGYSTPKLYADISDPDLGKTTVVIDNPGPGTVIPTITPDTQGKKASSKRKKAKRKVHYSVQIKHAPPQSQPTPGTK